MKRSHYYLFSSITLALALLLGISSLGRKSPEVSVKAHEEEHNHEPADENRLKLSAEQIKELGIAVATAEPGTLSQQLAARGKIILHPDQFAHVLPKISGVALEAKKNVGDQVKQGETLAVLESREMAEISANYLAALEKVKLTESLYEREFRLYKKHVSAEQDYLNAKSAYEEARIQLQLAQQKLRALGLDEESFLHLTQANPDLRLYPIVSPISGTVMSRHITKGEFIDNSATIYEIADLSTVWVEIGIYPKDLYKVHEGQTVEIAVPMHNQKESAKLIYLSPIIEEETIAAKAIAELKNTQGEWRPGTFVTVNIGTEEVPAPVVIAKNVVQNIEGKDYVFVRVPDGFEKREVRLGKSDQKNSEVLQGLKAGEKYAASQTFLLKAEMGKSEAEHQH